MGVTARDAREIIHRLFLNLGMTAMEILYMPALNKDNIRGLVSFDGRISSGKPWPKSGAW